MRTVLILGLLAASFVPIYFWTKSDSKEPAAPSSKSEKKEKNNDRVTEISSDDLLKLGNAKLAELKEKGVPGLARAFKSESPKSTILEPGQRFSQDTIVLLAEVSSPVFDNATMQASDLFISQTETGKKVFVTYSTRGEPFLGAVQIIEIDGIAPKLLQTVIFRDFDIHSLTEKNGILYLAGATSDPKFKSPAALEIITLENGLIPLPLSSKRIDLPSFAAVSVIKVRDQVFVATGNQSGGVVELNNVENVADGVIPYTSLEHQVHELDDARYLDYDEQHIYCVKGTDAGLWVLNREAKTSQLFHLNGATIPESKSTVEVADGRVLLALGDGGTQIFDTRTGKVNYSIPQAPHEDPSLSVTNAASGHYREIYTADGEAGASVFQFDNKGALQHLASINFGAGLSVNAIEYLDGILVAANGNGGVKLAKLVRKSQADETAEEKHYENYLKKRARDD